MTPTLFRFPHTGPLPQGQKIILRDLDIAGVGGVRREQIEFLKKHNDVAVWTYESLVPSEVYGIYQAELLRSLQIIRPHVVEEGPPLQLQEEHENLFPRLFPLTRNYLGLTAKKISQDYLHEMPWSSWLLQDHWRYFVGYVRRLFPERSPLHELAQWEWTVAWLETQNFELSAQGDPGQIVTNPSLQYVALAKDHSLLNKKAGVYAFVVHSEKKIILERALDAYHAELLDLVMEDRKFTRAQLVDMLSQTSELQPPLSTTDWQKKFQELQEAAIIMEVL